MDLLLARPLALPATRSATESSFGITNLCDLLSIPGSAASAGLFARDAMLSFHWYHRVGPLRTLHTLFLLGVTWRVLLRTLYTTQGTMCASGLQTVSEACGSARVLLHKCYLWVCKRISVYKQSSLCVTKELGEFHTILIIMLIIIITIILCEEIWERRLLPGNVGNNHPPIQFPLEIHFLCLPHVCIIMTHGSN